jgi:hypothetical protein
MRGEEDTKDIRENKKKEIEKLMDEGPIKMYTNDSDTGVQEMDINK